MSKLVYLSGLDGADVAEVAAQLNSIVEAMQALPDMPEYRMEQALAKTVLTFLDDEDSRAAVIGNAAQKSAMYADYYRSLLDSLGNLPAVVGRSTLVSTNALAPLAKAAPVGTFRPNDTDTRALFTIWRNWYNNNKDRADLKGKTFHQAVFGKFSNGFSFIEPANQWNQKGDYRSNYVKFHNYSQTPIQADMNRLGFADFSANPPAAQPAQPAAAPAAQPAAPAPAQTTPATIPPRNTMSTPATAVATAPAAAAAANPNAAKGPDAPKTEATGLAKVWADHKTIIIIAVVVLLIGGGAVIFWPKDKPKKKKKALNGLNGRKRRTAPKRRRTTATAKRKRKPRKRLNGASLLALPAAPSMPLTLAGPRKKRKKSTRKYRVYAKSVGVLAGRKAKRRTLPGTKKRKATKK